jgi:adenylate kinase family enzyme
MRKVIIIGCSGSGKSYFARKLRDKTGLPLYHLDNIWWRSDGTNIERVEFDSILGELLGRDEWIIDGNYKRTMERRMDACDTVFFFDLPTEVCLEGIRERKGKERSDMAWKGAPEHDDAEFVEFIKKYNVEHRPYVLELLGKYKDKNIVVFESREDADSFIELTDVEYT